MRLLRRVLALLFALAIVTMVPSAARAASWSPAPGDGDGADINIVGALDEPAKGASVAVGATLVLRGWVADSGARGWSGVNQVHVYDGAAGEGTPLGQGTVGLDRPDVARAFDNPSLSTSGFEVPVDTSGLAVGPHTLTVFASTPERGSWAWPVVIQVVGAMGTAVVSAPLDGVRFWCLAGNPSCHRDPWWAEGNQAGTSRLVQYDLLGSGLVTEERFTEAVWFVWQWPEGKTLLREAAAHGVRIESQVEPAGGALGTYASGSNQLYLAQHDAEAATWMLADLLVHELRHAADDRAGIAQGGTFGNCLEREQRAFATERRYLQWVNQRFAGFPTPTDMLVARLSSDELALYADLYTTLTTPNLTGDVARTYEAQCSRLPRI